VTTSKNGDIPEELEAYEKIQLGISIT